MTCQSCAKARKGIFQAATAIVRLDSAGVASGAKMAVEGISEKLAESARIRQATKTGHK